MNSLFSSSRLYFREWIEDDGEWLKKLNDNPKVLKFTGDKPFSSLNEAREFIEKYDHYSKYGFGRWAVVLKKQNVPIGWCGIKHNEEHIIDIGFRFFENYWNQGYATEAVNACIDYSFDKLGVIEIYGRTSNLNLAAKKVLEKAGFKFLKRGNVSGMEDACYYLITNTESQ